MIIKSLENSSDFFYDLIWQNMRASLSQKIFLNDFLFVVSEHSNKMMRSKSENTVFNILLLLKYYFKNLR